MRTLRELWPVILGFVLLAALWLGPLPAMSRTAFSAHMLLHLGIVALVAPLLALGLVRSGVCLDGARNIRVWAILAFSVEMIVVWGWHAPALHEAAARHVSVFVIQQISFLGAGLAVWLLGFASRSKAAVGAAVVGFFFSFIHMTMLGMLLILAPELIYPADLCLGAFGFEQLEDQRFGGVLMAAWGGLIYMAGGVVLGARLLLREEPEDSAPPLERQQL